MIYTVTFNPSLDYIVGTEGFQLGNTNRTVSELMLPGGKGPWDREHGPGIYGRVYGRGDPSQSERARVQK